jgi:predicted LPLAT superfamily acyltransferase
MPRWRGKSRGNKLGYSIVIFVCRKLGISSAYFILRFVTFYFFVFSWATSKPIYQYFKDRLHQPWFTSLLNIYRNYFVYSQVLLDKIVLLSGIKNNFTFHFDGIENLEKMIAGGKGGIILSAHVGNWDAGGNKLEELNTKFNIVMYDGESQNLKDFLNSITGARNINMIPVKNDMSHVYAISEALNKNELVCMHADRFLDGNKTVLRKFLGAGAQFPEGPFTMAAIFKVPIAVAFAFKKTSAHYHFFCSELMYHLPEERKDSYRNRLIDFFLKEVEDKLKRYPTQWFNYYRFWEEQKKLAE